MAGNTQRFFIKRLKREDCLFSSSLIIITSAIILNKSIELYTHPKKFFSAYFSTKCFILFINWEIFFRFVVNAAFRGPGEGQIQGFEDVICSVSRRYLKKPTQFCVCDCRLD